MAGDLLLFSDGYLGMDLILRKYVLPVADHNGLRVHLAPLGVDLSRISETISLAEVEAQKRCVVLEVAEPGDIPALGISLAITPLRKRFGAAEMNNVALLPYPKAFVHLSGLGRVGIGKVMVVTFGAVAYLGGPLRLLLTALCPRVVLCHVAEESRRVDSIFLSRRESRLDALEQSRRSVAPLRKEMKAMEVTFEEKYSRSGNLGLALSVEAAAERVDALIIGDASRGPVLFSRSPYRELLRYAPCDVLILKS